MNTKIIHRQKRKQKRQKPNENDRSSQAVVFSFYIPSFLPNAISIVSDFHASSTRRSAELCMSSTRGPRLRRQRFAAGFDNTVRPVLTRYRPHHDRPAGVVQHSIRLPILAGSAVPYRSNPTMTRQQLRHDDRRNAVGPAMNISDKGGHRAPIYPCRAVWRASWPP